MGTFKMNDGPASSARPDLGFSSDFFGADTALIIPISNVFLNPLP
jgi:hypothetical protein